MIYVDVPGLGPDDLDLDVIGDVLTLRGKRPSGSFERTFLLPGRVDPSGITADCANGILEIVIPGILDEETATTTRIEIGDGE